VVGGNSSRVGGSIKKGLATRKRKNFALHTHKRGKTHPYKSEKKYTTLIAARKKLADTLLSLPELIGE